VRAITTITADARTTTGGRWLLAAALGMSIAGAGSTVAGCGGDETSTGSPQAATETGAEESKSGADAGTDPTGNTYDASSQPRDARIKIAMKDSAFKPQYITARLGQTLVFTNDDAVAHEIKGPRRSVLLLGDPRARPDVRVPDQAGPAAEEHGLHLHDPSRTMRGGIVVTK
jgi:plastocyanin